MSTDTTPTTEVTLDTTDVTPKAAIDVEASNTHCVETELPREITAIRKEYSIVGDAFYVGINSESAPSWLTTLVDSTVATATSTEFGNYDTTLLNIQNAIDAIDVASNTYVEQINFDTFLGANIASHLSTLNSTVGSNSASIISLNTTVASNDSAISTRVDQVEVDYGDAINTNITNVQLAYAAADAAMASDITALQTAFTDQETDLSGYANAITGLQTYIGINSVTENPNGLGMLGRVDILEKQTDGSIDVLSNTYDVMAGIEEPNTNTANDITILDALPYVQWSNMTGIGNPVNNSRPYVDYSLQTPAASSIPVFENTVYTRADFTDAGTDKYWKFVSGAWTTIIVPETPVGGETAQELIDMATRNEDNAQIAFDSLKDVLRSAHVGDVYIMYNAVGETREYLRSYKFLKSSISVPLTDADGYGWAIVTDTDAQAIYMAALQARDVADGKISQFYAWGDNSGFDENNVAIDLWPTSYTITTTPPEYQLDSNYDYVNINAPTPPTTNTPEIDGVELVAAVTEFVDATDVAYWFSGGNLYRRVTIAEVLQGWDTAELVPTVSGDGSFIATGDMLTVFDPIEGDIATYWFNGTSWKTNGPSGIISRSKWYVDLENSVTSPHGSVATSLNVLDLKSEAYTDDASVNITSTFDYTNTMFLNGYHYISGFGLTTEGVAQGGLDGLTPSTAFDSKFWVNAKSFSLTNPDHPGVEAEFQITATGLLITLDQTEATKNEPKGVHTTAITYDKGDIVSNQGSSYLAIQNVPTSIVITNTSYWQLLSAIGDSGKGVDYWFKRSTGAPTGTPNSNGSDANGWYTDLNNAGLNIAGDLYIMRGDKAEGATTWTFGTATISTKKFNKEITLYKGPATSSGSLPTGSTYNFATEVLAHSNANSWVTSVPSVVSDGDKIFVTTALVSGNADEGNVSVTWNAATTYAHKSDGDTIYEVYEYSVDGSTLWHSDYATSDIYRRTATVTNGSQGAWSSAAQITGHTPVLGSDYYTTDGTFKSFIFRTAATIPTGVNLPSGGSFNGTSETPPTNWQDDPYYTADEITWVCSTLYTHNAVADTWSNSGWSAPAEYSKQGDNAPYITLTADKTVFACDAEGNLKSGEGSTITLTSSSGNFVSPAEPTAEGWSVTEGTIIGFDTTTDSNTRVVNFSDLTTETATIKSLIYHGSTFSSNPITISKVYDGVESIVAAISNGGGTITCDSTGTPKAGAYVDSAGSVTVMSGSTPLINSVTPGTPGTWYIQTNVATGISAGAVTNTGGASPATFADAFNITADTASIKWVIRIDPPVGSFYTVDLWQNFSKAYGSRGTAIASHQVIATSTQPAAYVSSNIAAFWNTSVSTLYQEEIEGDTIVVTNPHTTLGWTHIWEYNGTAWVSSSQYVYNGNMIVNGTVTAEHLETGIIIATDATFSGTLDIDSSGTGSGQRMEINNNQILVYDNTGTLRVKIGNLV